MAVAAGLDLCRLPGDRRLVRCPRRCGHSGGIHRTHRGTQHCRVRPVRGLGLQRARVRTTTLRTDLTDAQNAVQHLILDSADGKRRRIEQAADQARTRFGDQAIRPGTLVQLRW